MKTMPFQYNGAIVSEYPARGSSTCTLQATWPVAASSAVSLASSWPTKTLPPPKPTPRLTWPQHSGSAASPLYSGTYRHFSPPLVASNAYTWLCGPVTYIVPSTTTGELSNDVAELLPPVW